MFATIKAHALRDAPREACGLVCRRAGVLVAEPCQNTSPDAVNQFRIDFPAYLRSLRAGECVGYYHSHPRGSAEPSEPDRMIAEHIGLPAFIYSIADDRHACYRPEAFRAQRLENRAWVPLAHDSVTLAQDYLAALGTVLEVERTGERIVVRGGQTDEPRPEPGDVLVMALRGAQLPNHLAIYLGDGQMLHHPPGKASRREAWEGHWRDATQTILRFP